MSASGVSPVLLYWLAGSALIAGGLVLGAWALFFDRASRRGVTRRRCSRCWYDMGGVPGLKCPECGRTARVERHLFRTRRHPWWAAGAGVLVLAGAAVVTLPFYRHMEWPTVVPSAVLVRITPAREPVGPRVLGQAAVFSARLTPGASIGEQLDEEAWNRLIDGKLSLGPIPGSARSLLPTRGCSGAVGAAVSAALA